MRGTTVDDLDPLSFEVIDLEVIDLSEPARGRADDAVDLGDWRSFEERYAQLAFGLGTVPRRQHAIDSFWHRPEGLLAGVGMVLAFLMLLSVGH